MFLKQLSCFSYSFIYFKVSNSSYQAIIIYVKAYYIVVGIFYGSVYDLIVGRYLYLALPVKETPLKTPHLEEK